jgi:solute carrier family 25 phosphate transporter 23/24/25/41
MERGKTELDTPRRLSAGACAGITSVIFTYPLDIVRTRLSVQSAELGIYSSAAMGAMGASEGDVHGPPRKLLGIWKTMKIMYHEEGGIRALYRGLGATMAVGIAVGRQKKRCNVCHCHNDIIRE